MREPEQAVDVASADLVLERLGPADRVRADREHLPPLHAQCTARERTRVPADGLRVLGVGRGRGQAERRARATVEDHQREEARVHVLKLARRCLAPASARAKGLALLTRNFGCLRVRPSADKGSGQQGK
eukprot:2552832-Pleurochrysis_carterae.AAC.1